MWFHNLNPTLLHLGPLEIRWYGLVYVLGFILMIVLLIRASKKNQLNITKDQAWDLSFYLMLGVIIGSRLFEVFWEPKFYLSNPLNFLKFWEGGMSFHGGFVGIVVAGYLYCKKKQINFWRMADILSLPAMFSLALGRVANFINGELVGRIWNGSGCVIFPKTDEFCRHPQVLYGAAYRFIIFFGLLWMNVKEETKKFTPGFIFWNFVFWEGVGRFVVDFFREDVLYLGLTVGQWFSLAMIIVAGYFLIKKYKNDFKKLFK